MKKYIYSFLAVAAILCPGRADAFLPTMDAFTLPESVLTTSKLVQQFNKIKESTKTISDISNSLGSNLKTISELAAGAQKDLADAKAFAEKEQTRLSALESDIQSRREQLAAKQNYITDNVSKAKNYKSSVSSLIGSSPLNVDSIENEFNVNYDYDYDYEEDDVNTSDVETQNGANNNTTSTGTQNSPSRQGFGTSSNDSASSSTGSGSISSNQENFSTGSEYDVILEETPANSTENTSSLDNQIYQEDIFSTDQEMLSNGRELAVDGSEQVETEAPFTEQALSVKNIEKTETISNKIKDSLNKEAAKGTTSKIRRPFGKTSFYKKSETLALAQTTDKVYDGMKDGRFIFSKELAAYCKISVDDALSSAAIEKCFGELLSHMSDKNASNAAAGQKVYQEIVRDTTLRTLAESMMETLSAAQFENKKLEPLNNSLDAAGNTRDDLASLSMTNKEGVYVMNRSSYMAGLKLSLDSVKQLGYFNLTDYENSQKLASE